ncbi:sensor domain-containing diguanylate cyclase [bacterium]|nr:sensor domain-containing diguanylate cyclase [bacterium]
MANVSGIPDLLKRADEIERRYAELHRRYMELSKRVEELSTFREIGLAVNSLLDFEEVLETVLLKVTALFEATVGVIYLLDPTSEKLVPKIARYGSELRREDDLGEESNPIGEGPVGKALAERLGTIVEGADGYSYLVEPLIAKHEGIGVIEIARKSSQGRFDRKDSNLLSVISSEVAVAIHNALLYSLATTDSLTRLYVRRYFDLRLKEEFFAARRYKQPLSILMIDIDHFKSFNDRYGHQTGDFLLKQIAEIITRNCRRSDVPCRYGGEEFTVILAATGLKGASTVGEKMRQQIGQREFSFGRVKGLKITVSIGVATYRIGMRTPEDLVAIADAALYKAKAKGRNAVVIAETE